VSLVPWNRLGSGSLAENDGNYFLIRPMVRKPRSPDLAPPFKSHSWTRPEGLASVPTVAMRLTPAVGLSSAPLQVVEISRRMQCAVPDLNTPQRLFNHVERVVFRPSTHFQFRRATEPLQFVKLCTRIISRFTHSLRPTFVRP